MGAGTAVILLSGGLDSATVAAVARSEGYDLCCLSFNYGQTHRLELESARKVAASVGCREHLVIRADMGGIGGSALTDESIEVPRDRDLSRSAPGGVPVTYVPARNTVFLSFALGWAEVLGAWDIFLGANAVDYSGYPDCRPEYLAAFERMANLATRASTEGHGRFRIHAPLIDLTKGGIIRLGLSLGLDYSLTWSCYHPGAAGRPCGACDSCLFRAKGFREAGLADPLLSTTDCPPAPPF